MLLLTIKKFEQLSLAFLGDGNGKCYLVRPLAVCYLTLQGFYLSAHNIAQRVINRYNVAAIESGGGCTSLVNSQFHSIAIRIYKSFHSQFDASIIAGNDSQNIGEVVVQKGVQDGLARCAMGFSGIGVILGFTLQTDDVGKAVVGRVCVFVRVFAEDAAGLLSIGYGEEKADELRTQDFLLVLDCLGDSVVGHHFILGRSVQRVV